ncbi:Signal transduction histidine kinase [Blastococcus aurantiacus]|uniref:histidine kinase n=1 Tax=Blastococcus aurantiacus TaxID=1550231 RepID=A0A1G7QG49_9ACTN|nr:HAMP domain-containing sensor histidine kinase [Blastococcus aurantiacus]SDF97537.1 Signal transduction histidine kinase [Blastococcus aurantiacus]
MRIGLRARVVLAVLLTVVVGRFWFDWAWHLGTNLIDHVGTPSYTTCYGDWRELGYACENVQFLGPYGLTLLLGVTAVVAVGLFVLLRWVLRPLNQVTGTVRRLGPQNLAERIGTPGRRDELRRLSAEIDRMLDRVAEGYDGQRRFAGNASHELRTPLAVQRTLIEVGLSGDPTPEQLELLSRQLLQTNERNEQLIEGLLVLAETDQGLRSRTPQQLDELARAAVALHADTARTAGVTLHAELAPVTVPGEAALLDRLLSNLLYNAVKYNEPGGWVCVRVADGQPVLEVENSGPVVPAELVPTLFEPFRRARGDRLVHSGGAGLGLTIVRSIATAHDGTVDAVARPDGGLVVQVDLPDDDG